MDFKNNYSIAATLNPSTRNAAGNGTGVDIIGSIDTGIMALPGTVTDGAHTLTVQESADNSAWTTVAASDLIGTFAALASNTVQVVTYVGNKRYLRVNNTSSGATGALFGIYIARSLRKKP